MTNASPKDSDPSDEAFEQYLRQRRAKRRIALIIAPLVVVGLVAIPYALMGMGFISDTTVAIFGVIDFFLLAGCARALVLHLSDRTGIPL